MKIIATTKRCHAEAARGVANLGDVVVTTKEQFNALDLATLRPQAIYFPHWSWLIPDDITKNYRCIIFHMTPLPYGRGGSPLQNLILRGFTKTVISAVLADGGLDTGNILMQKPLSLKGTADQILKRASKVIAKMIRELDGSTDQGEPQQGEVVAFKRRKPSDSDLTVAAPPTAEDFYNFVRMLDGEGYPPAFIDIGPIRIELTHITPDGHGHFHAYERKENPGHRGPS